jgi:hypothetical protein
MSNLTREQILARKIGREVVTLPDGDTVEIRGLTHAEVIEGQAFDNLNERTCFYVARSLVDPEMSFDDVLAWAAAGSAGDITTISEAVQRVSRLTEGAGKSGVPRAGRRRRS